MRLIDQQKGTLRGGSLLPFQSYTQKLNNVPPGPPCSPWCSWRTLCSSAKPEIRCDTLNGAVCTLGWFPLLRLGSDGGISVLKVCFVLIYRINCISLQLIFKSVFLLGVQELLKRFAVVLFLLLSWILMILSVTVLVLRVLWWFCWTYCSTAVPGGVAMGGVKPAP